MFKASRASPKTEKSIRFGRHQDRTHPERNRYGKENLGPCLNLISAPAGLLQNPAIEFDVGRLQPYFFLRKGRILEFGVIACQSQIADGVEEPGMSRFRIFAQFGD